MIGCNIHFKGALWEIIPKLSFYFFLSDIQSISEAKTIYSFAGCETPSL